ncbi:MAG: 3-hydroxybutyryl-CoA dehydrogenase [Candidatus Aminicenantes bacterium]|nr:3-hydroxybutyryl-CoA dehydrogenase [Candidatus Aminicenantes bacterium]NIM79703.1 3-hydroxybutyryl-CoA dehydrogenase [Candidatus Aminicenantes bacterium]NIN19033.1 3-hydroxybutyryl-CoA dehydrogenase [Candidatus Aminicenantes bacterium]NIN42935.1 3-hydroxybutyryl-CoA dehydrogenase [Candidatus Aminicenantes bacterium]NIN85672.1 3-hydroxybutyryl-CoA dehydrogenase [Candidatus Aminicenantes bacterium]
MEFKKIGVIGAGTMGVGVTVDLVLHGIQTLLVDTADKVLENARSEITKSIRFAPLVHKGAPKVPVKEAMEKITFTTDIKEVADCQWIIENVTEKWEVKEKVYRELDQKCDPEALFGVDTSCISITKIASITTRPDKVIGMHFINPVFAKPVIEVMRGFHTSDETIEKAEQLLAQLDKKAIVVNDYPGFVTNRISHLFMNEAMWVVQDGVATPEQVDNIFKQCFGHKMGPLETADLIGLDTVMHSLEVLYESYQDPKFRCCPLLKKKVDAGLLGRKSGKGFHDYSKKG